jgi:hypothetical protein
MGPEVLIDNALKFCAAGATPDGTPQTGFYMAMSYYYEAAFTEEEVEPVRVPDDTLTLIESTPASNAVIISVGFNR